MSNDVRDSIRVRDITAGDAPEVARLLGELGYAWTVDEVSARIASFLARGERGLVATRSTQETAGRLLGLLTLHVTPVLHRAGPVGRLTALVVDASARGQGVGRALVNAAEAHFLAQGCVLVEVTSNESRTDAHAFYTKLGYAKTSLRFGKPLRTIS